MNAFVAEIAGDGRGRKGGGGQKDAAKAVGNRGAAMVNADKNGGTIDESVAEMQGVNAEVAHEGQG